MEHPDFDDFLTSSLEYPLNQYPGGAGRVEARPTKMARSPGSGGPRRPNPILTYEEGEAGPHNRPLLQVVIYPKALTVEQFDWLLHLYQSLVPPDRITRFKISELPSRP